VYSRMWIYDIVLVTHLNRYDVYDYYDVRVIHSIANAKTYIASCCSSILLMLPNWDFCLSMLYLVRESEILQFIDKHAMYNQI